LPFIQIRRMAPHLPNVNSNSLQIFFRYRPSPQSSPPWLVITQIQVEKCPRASSSSQGNQLKPTARQPKKILIIYSIMISCKIFWPCNSFFEFITISSPLYYFFSSKDCRLAYYSIPFRFFFRFCTNARNKDNNLAVCEKIPVPTTCEQKNASPYSSTIRYRRRTFRAKTTLREVDTEGAEELESGGGHRSVGKMTISIMWERVECLAQMYLTAKRF
jgi:hypothetical protein